MSFKAKWKLSMPKCKSMGVVDFTDVCFGSHTCQCAITYFSVSHFLKMENVKFSKNCKKYLYITRHMGV